MQPTQTIQPPQPTGGRRRRVVDEDPDERRRKFLERNRAAATRCRQKRKVWVMSLEKKAEELTQTNMQLQVQPLAPSAALKRPCVQMALPVAALGAQGPSSHTTHQPTQQLQVLLPELFIGDLQSTISPSVSALQSSGGRPQEFRGSERWPRRVTLRLCLPLASARFPRLQNGKITRSVAGRNR